MRSALALAAAAVATLAGPGRAAAHGFEVYPEHYELLAGPGPTPQRLVLATTYGLVLSDDGGATWRWVCETAFGVAGSWAPEYEVTGTGAITATTMAGLAITRDGCTWTPAAGAAGTQTAASTAWAGGTLWLASIGDGQVQVRSSTDDGATWSEAAPIAGALWATRIAASPSDPLRVYVSGDFYDGATRIPKLWRSVDAGAHWDELPTATFTTTMRSSFQLAAIDPADPDRIFARVTQTGAALEERLYRSIDGGDTWTQALQVADTITAVVVRGDGSALVSTQQSGLFRSPGGVADFVAIGGGVHKATCLTELGDHQLYLCADNFTPDFMGLGRSSDGATWTKIMTMTDLAGPVACPAGTVQRDECEQGAWCFYQRTYGLSPTAVDCDTDPPVPPPDDPRVCGCGAAGAPTGLGAALLVALGLRRRRRG